MTSREFLRRYEAAVIKADRLREEYKEQEKIIDAIKSPLGGDGIHAGGITKTVEAQAVRLALKAERYKEAQLEAIRIRQEIVAVINQVSGYSGAILYARYIQLEDWEQISESVGYSRAQTFRLHLQGMQEVEEIINREDTAVF